MDVTLHIPDELAEPLNAAAGDLSRRALEAFALEEYKNRRISKTHLRRLLGFETRYELDGFLKAHEVWDDVGIEELERQMRDLKCPGL
jgi:hypothetical protein